VESCTPRRTGGESDELTHRRERKAGSDGWPMTPSQMMSDSSVRSERHLVQTKRGGGETEEEEGKEGEVGAGAGGEREKGGRRGEVASAADDDWSPASRCSIQSFPMALNDSFGKLGSVLLIADAGGENGCGLVDASDKLPLPPEMAICFVPVPTRGGGKSIPSSSLAARTSLSLAGMASPPSSAKQQQQYVAAVVGSTGATGAALLEALKNSQRFSKVVAIARSPASSTSSPSKIVPVRLDLDQLAEAAAAASSASSSPSSSSSSSSPRPNPLEGVDAVFVALGTTRSAAGSAEAFWRVDVGGVASAAALAAAARAPLFSLVSAAGASRGAGWRPTLSLLHPLYYAAAKGAAEEEALVASKSASVAIYRPGLLDRGEEKQRGGERWAIKCGLPSLKVEDLAAVMVADAVAELDKVKSGGASSGEVVKGDGEIKREAATAVLR